MSKLEDSAKGEKSFGMMIYEPPYTRPAWPVLTKEGSGGVRGAVATFKSSPVYSIVCSKYTHSFKLVCFVEWYTYVVVRIVNNKNTFDLYFVIIGYIVHVSIWSVIRK